MTCDNKKVGAIGEHFATQFLKNNGYTILARNFRFSKLGEIDIISQKGDFICFIEVKTRKNLNYGMPNESVTFSKQQKIRLISEIFIAQNKLYCNNIRFDIIEVLIEKRYNEVVLKDINLIENAF